MSGHSKWSSIKHKKGAADAKRGKLFSKLTRAIIVAAREGRLLVAAFHPELTDDTRVHERFLNIVREATGVRA